MTRGGKREGSGRKRLPDLQKKVTVQLSVYAWQVLHYGSMDALKEHLYSKLPKNPKREVNEK